MQQRAIKTPPSLLARCKNAVSLAGPIVSVIGLMILIKIQPKPIILEPDDTILPEYSDMLSKLASHNKLPLQKIQLIKILKLYSSFNSSLDTKIEYGDLSHVIRNLNYYIENPDKAFITEHQLALKIHQQANLLAYYKSDQKHKLQIALPTHPRSYLIHHLVELWFVLPKGEKPSRIDFGPMNPEKKTVHITSINLNNRLTVTRQSPAGPYFFQPVPYMNAANLIKLSSYETQGENELDELLQEWSEELASYPYGMLYSLPHLISGTIESKHIFGLTYGTAIAEAAMKFPGVLLDPKFSKAKRDKWFNLFIEGKFGSKSNDWYDAMLKMYHKENIPDSWKEKIKSSVKKEESKSPYVKRILSQMD